MLEILIDWVFVARNMSHNLITANTQLDLSSENTYQCW